MCIIAIKEKGIDMPNEKILETMFEHNPDGAGFMYAKDGHVHIRKGFMTYTAFKKAVDRIEKVKELPLVMHFRIATSGSIDAGTCHPFPISNKRKVLRKTDITTDIGIVHNGVIPITAPNNMSDTMQYIAGKLYYYQKLQQNFYVKKSYMERIEKEIQSKMVFLTSNGDIYKIGDFITDNGMIYSNTSYKSYTYPYHFSFDDDFYGYRSSAMLCPIEGYLQDEFGQFIDCCDGLYLMDKHSRVYEYNFDFNVAEPILATAFAYSGLPYVFNEYEAIKFEICI